MHRTNLLATGLTLLLVSAPAFAQEAPRLIGGGDDAQVVYSDGNRGNIVGGGRATILNDAGGGFIATYHDTMPATAAGLATLSGGGEDGTVSYTAPAANARLASRR